MLSSRPLCRLCERPTADGAVRASHMDKVMLQTWFLDVYEYKLTVDIEDADLICFYCIWHAEFVAKNDPELKGLAWWPASLDYLDGMATELRKEYLEGKAEKCWAQVTSRQPKSSIQESPEPLAGAGSRKKCFYCGIYSSTTGNMTQHIKRKHKDAIRCNFSNCPTYFHTLEEKAEHMLEEHEKPKEQRLLSCMFCERQFKKCDKCRAHILSYHPEYSVPCEIRGCLWYFKRGEELQSHLKSVHKIEDEALVLKCRFCEFKTILKKHMNAHITRMHTAKMIECDDCGKMFSTKESLSTHLRLACKICGSHSRKRHRNSCKKVLFECDQCPKTFRVQSRLEYHKKNHMWRGLKYKKLGFKCESCKRYYASVYHFKQHLRTVHTKQGFKQCAHCSKSFSYIVDLIRHLAHVHDLIERKFECDKCENKYATSRCLKNHKNTSHLRDKTLANCPFCEKSVVAYYLSRHLLIMHGFVNT